MSDGCFYEFWWVLWFENQGLGENPLQAQTGDFFGDENARLPTLCHEECHACSPKQSPFWGFALLGTAGLKKTVKNKKTAKALRAENHNSFCVYCRWVYSNVL